MFFINWLHTFEPTRQACTILGWPVYWYGLGYTIAFLISFFGGRYLLEEKLREVWERVWWWAIVGGLLGARLYFVLIVEPVYFWHHPLEVVAVWHGGMAIFGGLLGGFLGIWYYTKKLSAVSLQLSAQNVWFWTDFTVIFLALGQAIGRWGNYFNQELYGRVTDLPWGIPITGQALYFHPTFLYESVLDIALALGLWYIWQYGRRHLWASGKVTALYLCGYGLNRFVMEFWRIDTVPLWFGIRQHQVVSAGLIVLGILIFYKLWKTDKGNQKVA